MTSTRTTWLWLGLMVPAACDSDPSPRTPAPVAIEALTAEMATVYCTQMRRCCNEADLGAFSPLARESLVSDGCATNPRTVGFLDAQFNLARLRQSVTMGRSQFDAALAGACVDRLKQLSCPGWSAALLGQQAALGVACQRMVRGTVADGQPCQLNFAHECQSGSCGNVMPAPLCAPSSKEGQMCDGRCEDVLDCNQRCEGELLCSPDNVCARDPQPQANGFCDGS